MTRLRPYRERLGSRTDLPLEPPRPLMWCAVVVLATAMVMALWGALATGTAWDETYHVERLQNLFDRGWYLTDGDFTGKTPGSWVHDKYVYAPVTMLLLHGLDVVAGGQWESVSFDSAAVAVRHTGVLLIGLLGVGSAAALGRLALGSWRWGMVTSALLLATPLWLGHSMFNIKDVPVATGYTMTTLGLALLVQSPPTRQSVSLGCIVYWAGATLAVGTRPGIWVGIAGAAVVAFGLVGGARLAGEKRAWRQAARVLLVVPLLALVYLVLWVLYPNGFRDPGTLLFESVSASSSYRGGAQGYWLYLPLQTLITTPLPLLMLLLLGAFFCARSLLRRGLRNSSVQCLLLVGAQTFALPIMAMMRQSDLYNGLRQVLFVAPTAAVLATVGVAWLVARLDARAYSWGVAAIAVAGMALPMMAQVQLFPYNYTFNNVLVDAAGLRPETDYWRTSVRELAPDLPTSGLVVCSPYTIDGLATRATFDGVNDCRTHRIGPLAAYINPGRAGRGGKDRVAPEVFYAVIERTAYLPANCEDLASVTRQLRFRTLTMSHLARCRANFPALGATPVSVGPSVENMAALVNGWSIRRAEDGARATSRQASFGVRIPDRGGSAARKLVVSGGGLNDVHITTDGRTLEVTSSDTRAEVELGEWASGPTVFSLRTGGVGNLRVTSIGLDD